MKRSILSLLVLFCALSVIAQDFNWYLQSAQNKFDLGDYENAQKALNVYAVVTGQSETDLSVRITTALQLLKSAQTSTDNQEYAHAITLYNQVLLINPKDPHVKDKIIKLQSFINNTPKENQSNAIESKQFQIGDKVGGYSVCYLDKTKTSGWVIRIDNRKGTWPNKQNDSSVWRIPSLDEYKIIYKNRFKLGLNKSYWTSTQSKKIANWKFYYIFDFGTGKEKSTDMYKFYPVIYIRNF